MKIKSLTWWNRTSTLLITTFDGVFHIFKLVFSLIGYQVSHLYLHSDDNLNFLYIVIYRIFLAGQTNVRRAVPIPFNFFMLLRITLTKLEAVIHSSCDWIDSASQNSLLFTSFKDGGDNFSLLPHHSFLKQQRIFCSGEITTRTWLRAHQSHVEIDKICTWHW